MEEGLEQRLLPELTTKLEVDLVPGLLAGMAVRVEGPHEDKP